MSILPTQAAYGTKVNIVGTDITKFIIASLCLPDETTYVAIVTDWNPNGSELDLFDVHEHTIAVEELNDLDFLYGPEIGDSVVIKGGKGRPTVYSLVAFDGTSDNTVAILRSIRSGQLREAQIEDLMPA